MSGWTVAGAERRCGNCGVTIPVKAVAYELRIVTVTVEVRRVRCVDCGRSMTYDPVPAPEFVTDGSESQEVRQDAPTSQGFVTAGELAMRQMRGRR